MDPDVVHDPVYAELVAKHERACRKLRDAVAAMRSFYLTHHKRPLDESSAERWRGALLSEEAVQRHEEAVDAAAQLLRYAFEIAPHSNDGLHMEEILKLKAAHRERLERRTGWGKAAPHPKGIEEKVSVDGGPPITLVIDPKHYDYTERGKRARARREGKPAMDPSTQPPAEPEESGE